MGAVVTLAAVTVPVLMLVLITFSGFHPALLALVAMRALVPVPVAFFGIVALLALVTMRVLVVALAAVTVPLLVLVLVTFFGIPPALLALVAMRVLVTTVAAVTVLMLVALFVVM